MCDLSCEFRGELNWGTEQPKLFPELILPTFWLPQGCSSVVPRGWKAVLRLHMLLKPPGLGK